MNNQKKHRMKSIKLIVYDFDGVMTDNRLYVDQNGIEMVQVNRADGLAISEIKKMHIKQIIISTETNPVVSARANKLGILCLQGIENKKETLLNFSEENNFYLKDVAYIGNDINDKDVMETVGITLCPSDAHKSIIAISNYVLKTKGGHGVIRELLDLINN